MKQTRYEAKLEHYEAIKEAIEEIIHAAKQGWPLDDFWGKIRFRLDMVWSDAYMLGKEEIKEKVKELLSQS